jgi:hypothetical protein
MGLPRSTNRAPIDLLQCLRLPKLAQSNERLMTHEKLFIASVDDDLFHLTSPYITPSSS